MTIMRIIGRSILRQHLPACSPRLLSTAAAAEEEKPTVKKQTETKGKRLIFQDVAKESSKSSVADFLNRWLKKGHKLEKFELINLSTFFRNRKNFQAALQLYDWMKSSNYEMTNSDHAIRIHLLYKTEGLASAAKYFHSLHKSEKDNKTYGALLCCYCSERDVDRAMEFFEAMKIFNYASTLNYNSVLTLHYKMAQHEKFVSLVEEMEKNNVDLNLFSYNMLINSYAAVKNFDALDGVLEKMKSNKVDCDLFTYANLATVHFNAGLHEKAKSFLDMAEKMKVQSQPNKQVFQGYQIIIRLYSEMDNLSGVQSAWESFKSAFPKSSNSTYLVMLLALAKLGDQENLEKIFEEWELRCTTYDYRLPNVLLRYYLDRDMIKEATSVYQRSMKKRAGPNLHALSSFATLCVKNGQIDSALEYLEMGLEKVKSENHAWFPRDDTVQLFVNYFEENKDEDRAEKFTQIMKKVKRLDSSSLLLNIKASDAGANI